MARSIELNSVVITTCALIGTSRELAALQLHEQPSALTTLEYELVDANGDVQKVRVETATRSAVATFIINKKIKINKN